MQRFVFRLFLITLLLLPAGCSPSLSPLYRDYRAGPETDVLRSRIEAALQAAGWELTAAEVPGLISTRPRRISHAGLYSVSVSLDVIPLGGPHIRVLMHPWRHYILGGRSKIPFANDTLRRNVLRELNAAFEAAGLVPLGTSLAKEREQMDG